MKRTKDYRRFVAKTHINHKKSISQHIYFFDWYDNDNQYSKNKVHCSCEYCASFDAYYEWLRLHGISDSFKEQLLEANLNPILPNRHSRLRKNHHRHSRG